MNTVAVTPQVHFSKIPFFPCFILKLSLWKILSENITQMIIYLAILDIEKLRYASLPPERLKYEGLNIAGSTPLINIPAYVGNQVRTEMAFYRMPTSTLFN